MCFVLLSPDKPGPPAGIINFNSITADKIIFSWEPVPESDKGGSKVTHYIVERRETSRVVWSTVSERHEQTFVTVGKLVRGNEYVFRVMGVNKFGVGVPLESEPVIAKNAFGMSSLIRISCHFQSICLFITCLFSFIFIK